MAEPRHQPGPGQPAQGPLFLEVEDDRAFGLAPHEERDDEVVADLGALHHALVTVDPHAGSVAPRCDAAQAGRAVYGRRPLRSSSRTWIGASAPTLPLGPDPNTPIEGII